MHRNNLLLKISVAVTFFICVMMAIPVMGQSQAKIISEETFGKSNNASTTIPPTINSAIFCEESYAKDRLLKSIKSVESSATKTLLIEDIYPWGENALDKALDAHFIEYDKVKSAKLTSTNLDLYGCIIVASSQFDDCYININTNMSRIETFVSNGGTLIFWGAGYYGRTYPSALTLPGGTKTNLPSNYDYYAYNHVVMPNHPFVQDVPTELLGSSASHGYLVNYPEGASIIILTGPSEDAALAANNIKMDQLQKTNMAYKPTLIEYNYGLGTVIASTMTIEAGVAWYNGGTNWAGFPKLLDNIIDSSIPKNTTRPILSNMEESELYYGTKTTTKKVTASTTASGPAKCSSAVIKVAENYSKGKDVLILNPGTGLRSSFNVATGTLTVSGYAPITVYQNVIRNIIYLYFSSTTIPSSTPYRRIDFTLYNGTTAGNTVSRYITFNNNPKKLDAEEENALAQVPTEFSLYQNYPNPFNPVTNIRFAIPTDGFTTLKVYNTLGQEVSSLMNEDLTAGTYEVQFDGSKLSSGTYFYRLTSGNSVETKKFILMK
jgi:hypothetical protein